MESNKTVQVNWGTFNVPTLLSVLGILWYTATHTAVQDQRIGTIEDSRSITKIEYTKRIDSLESQVAKIDNLAYRTTINEAGIVAVNSRLDRFSDAFQDIRKSLGDLSTKFEVVSTKIDNAFPFKKSELVPVPPELARRN